MKAQIELKSVDMKISNELDFLRCLARLSMAEAYPGYGEVFLGCLAETAAAAHEERPSIKKFENKIKQKEEQKMRRVNSSFKKGNFFSTSILLILGLLILIPQLSWGSSPVIRYHFEGNAQNVASNLYHGLIQGTPVFVPGDLPVGDLALQFDGSYNYVNVSGSQGIDFSQGLSVEAKIFRETNTSEDAIVSKWMGEDQWLLTLYPGNKLIFAVRLSDGTYSNLEYDITDSYLNRWVTVRATYDPQIGQFLSWDGEISYKFAPGQIYGGSSTIHVGDASNTWSRFDGKIDDVKIWDTPSRIVRFPTDVKTSKIEPYFNFGEYIERWKDCEGNDKGSANKFHAGIDIIDAEAIGTLEEPPNPTKCKEPSLGKEVYPIARGTVHRIHDLNDDGFCVIINHGDMDGTGYIYSAYWHIGGETKDEEPYVEEGDQVNTQTVLGIIGDYGNNPHLHFEIRDFPFRCANDQPPCAYIDGDPINEGYFNPCDFIYNYGGDVPSNCGEYRSQEQASLDLSFVIDSSGSMWDDIANVKNSMTQILNAVETKVDDYRISIVDFKHYYYSAYATRAALDFTNYTSSILSAINSLTASGGASPGEAVYAGLMCAFTNCSFGAGSGMSPWRDDALKIAILLGDEPPYTGSQEFTFAQVVATAEAGGALTKKATSATDGIHIYSILIGNNSTAEYYFKNLAEDTGGKFFNALTANDVVAAILEAIGSIPGPGPTNSAPDVSGATASVSNIWPPNNKMVDIQILDVVDPDGDPIIITITAITQDEPVNQTGSKNKEPDAEGIGTDTAWVRAERDGNGNGRVYEITFEASDDKGATAEGSVFVCVPHDQGEDTVCINDGQNYDSTSYK